MEKERIINRINRLRARMKEAGVSLYLVTDMDFHMSEFLHGYFETLRYLTGFTGHDAILIVTGENAHLWTDARYDLQARRELAGTGIELHLAEDPSDPIRTIPLFFEAAREALFDQMYSYSEEDTEEMLVSGFRKELIQTIGFDGRTVPYMLYREIEESIGVPFDSGMVRFEPALDLVGDIWEDRPGMPLDPILFFPEMEDETIVMERIARIREKFEYYGPDGGAVLTALDDIAWLFGFRGSDIPYSMTAYAYAYLTLDSAILFIDSRKISEEGRAYFARIEVELREYNSFYAFLENLDANYVILDAEKNNYAVVYTVDRHETFPIVNMERLIEEEKAVKSLREIQMKEEVQIRDGVAVTRWMKWLKESIGDPALTERSAAEKLWEFREAAGAICPSFETISAYGEHAAIVHYMPSETENAVIGADGFYLSDSGAHYPGGTTDVTRTIPTGALTERERAVYTRVLASMLEVCYAVFPAGLLDIQLDAIARKPLWDAGMEFDHSTGHGVGTMLNVHEGPQSLCWLKDGAPTELKPGMITTAEPGMYFEVPGFGVRHEIELVIEKSMYDGMLTMRPITYVPIETAPILPDLLTEEERQRLAAYNDLVLEKLSPYLEPDEVKWLREISMPV